MKGNLLTRHDHREVDVSGPPFQLNFIIFPRVSIGYKQPSLPSVPREFIGKEDAESTGDFRVFRPLVRLCP